MDGLNISIISSFRSPNRNSKDFKYLFIINSQNRAYLRLKSVTFTTSIKAQQFAVCIHTYTEQDKSYLKFHRNDKDSVQKPINTLKGFCKHARSQIILNGANMINDPNTFNSFNTLYSIIQ